MTTGGTEHSTGRELDRMTSAELVRTVVEEDRRGLDLVHAAAPALAGLADRIASRIGDGGRWITFGAGTSGRLAVVDAVELLPTFGIDERQVVARMAGGRDAMFLAREGAEDDRSRAAEAVAELGVGRGDLVLGVSAGGRTPYTCGAVAKAGELGAETAFLTCSDVPADLADRIVVLATGPEVLAGSTRMKAGTATKVALHAVSLAVATRLGHVYGDRMVDVRAGSEKLRDRARGMVADLAGVSDEAAAELLERAGGAVKVAIVMARLEVDETEARRRLTTAGGHLRDVLGDW